MPLAQALQEPSPEEIAAKETAEQARVLIRSQWLNDPYTKAKIEQVVNLRHTQTVNALTYSLQPGKEAEALAAAKNAAIADQIIGLLTA